MDVQLINEELLSDLYRQASLNERKRQFFDLRTSSLDTSQRMLNVLEIGTEVPIHRHDETTETVICIKGKLDEVFYEEVPSSNSIEGEGNRFKEVARFTLCPADGTYGIQVPKGMWHTIEVLEPCVIFEAKDGAYGDSPMKG